MGCKPNSCAAAPIRKSFCSRFATGSSSPFCDWWPEDHPACDAPPSPPPVASQTDCPGDTQRLPSRSKPGAPPRKAGCSCPHTAPHKHLLLFVQLLEMNRMFGGKRLLVQWHICQPSRTGPEKNEKVHLLSSW